MPAGALGGTIVGGLTGGTALGAAALGPILGLVTYGVGAVVDNQKEKKALHESHIPRRRIAAMSAGLMSGLETRQRSLMALAQMAFQWGQQRQGYL